MPEETPAKRYARHARVFMALSNDSGHAILHSLEHGERNVSQIAMVTGTTLSNASHFFRNLYKKGIVESRMQHREVFYRLKAPEVLQASRIVSEVAADEKVNRPQGSLFEALAEPQRIAILELLREGAMPRAKMVEKLGVKPNSIAKHLELLYFANLVAYEPFGKGTKYRLVTPRILDAIKTMDEALEEGK